MNLRSWDLTDAATGPSPRSRAVDGPFCIRRSRAEPNRKSSSSRHPVAGDDRSRGVRRGA